MDCTEFLARYSDYDDSLVPADEADRFRAHMADCDACARYDRVLRKGRMLARQLPPPEPSREFVPRLTARLWQESHATRRPAAWTAPAAALAALTLLLSVTAALGVLALDATGPGEAVPIAAVPGPDATRGGAATKPARSAVDERRKVLPAVRFAGPRAWAAERVDRAVPASYSPLITGPPAYRPARTPAAASIPMHSLD